MVGITNKTLIAEIRRQQQLSQGIIEGQTAISTGITLTKPSDNALAWVQVSEIGKAQAQQSSWQANVSYGQGRAANAESNLEEINNLLISAQELVTSARNGSLNDAQRTAIYEDVKGIREAIGSLLNQSDYQGVPVFDDTHSVLSVLAQQGLHIRGIAAGSIPGKADQRQRLELCQCRGLAPAQRMMHGHGGHERVVEQRCVMQPRLGLEGADQAGQADLDALVAQMFRLDLGQQFDQFELHVRVFAPEGLHRRRHDGVDQRADEADT